MCDLPNIDFYDELKNIFNEFALLKYLLDFYNPIIALFYTAKNVTSSSKIIDATRGLIYIKSQNKNIVYINYKEIYITMFIDSFKDIYETLFDDVRYMEVLDMISIRINDNILDDIVKILYNIEKRELEERYKFMLKMA